MSIIVRSTGWRPWFLLSVIGLALAAGDVRSQGVFAPPPWPDLLKNELVVVGQYRSHKNGVLSLHVVEVLRGKTCKAGDVLPVKFSQKIGFKFHLLDEKTGFVVDRFVAANDKERYPRMFFVDERDGQLDERPITYNAGLPHTYFFAKDGQAILDRPEQLQPDWRRGWKQVLAGKPVILSFQILYDPQSELSLKAIAELSRTRDPQAIEELVDALPERGGVPRLFPGRTLARRVLLSLGDRNGDVYDPVRKALKPHMDTASAAHLAQLLPLLDSKRALTDLQRMLGPGTGVSSAAVCSALVGLDSEEGLDLMFDWMQGGDIYAYGSLQTMMFDRVGSGRTVQRARLQDLAVPRLQKLLRNRGLPADVYSQAMFWQNFCFLAQEPPPEARGWQMVNGPAFYPDNRCPRRDGFPRWDHVQWEAEDLEPILKADLALGRKLLTERLARAPKPGPDGPFDLLILKSLAHRYGDADMARKFKKPVDPIVRVRHADTRKANMRGVPFSDFMPAFEDTLKLSPDYTGRLLALFPDHADVYFRELQTLIVSEDKPQREFAIRQLEDIFFWNFDFHLDDFPIACKRKLEAIKPLLARLGRSRDLLAMRGLLLQHFGVKLEGPGGRGWLPAVEAAVLRWNAVVHLNALCVLGMIEEDPEVMRFVYRPLSVRQRELEAYLKQLRVKRGNISTRTPEELQALWQDLGHAKQATSYAAMRSLVEGREAAVAWLGKRLKQPGRDPVRDVRAIQVLEYMPGRVGHTLLEELAAGPEGLATTHEARQALQRLARFWRW
jgi:hypothetical protein